MTNSSNDFGRALELQIVKEILAFLDSKKIKTSLTSRAKEYNTRDEIYLNALSQFQNQDFKKCSQIFKNWVDRNKWFDQAKQVTIDRLPDSAGIRGDVTDIRFSISDGKKEVIKNLSVKNHHNDLKHPRLPNFPKQCGITDIKILEDYKKKHDNIWLEFVKSAKKLKSDSIAFNELKSIDPSFIDKNLYRPLNEMIIGEILRKLDAGRVKRLFTFLKGNTNFYTLKNESQKVIIKNFNDIPEPTKIEIVYPKNIDNTFLLKFNNNWDITLRLHNSSTYFIKHNKLKHEVKYAVDCINIEKVIKTEEIAKV